VSFIRLRRDDAAVGLERNVSSSKVSSRSQFTSSFGIGELDETDSEADMVVEVVPGVLEGLIFEHNVWLCSRVVSGVEGATNEVEL